MCSPLSTNSFSMFMPHVALCSVRKYECVCVCVCICECVAYTVSTMHFVPVLIHVNFLQRVHTVHVHYAMKPSGPRGLVTYTHPCTMKLRGLWVLEPYRNCYRHLCAKCSLLFKTHVYLQISLLYTTKG